MLLDDLAASDKASGIDGNALSAIVGFVDAD